MRKIRGFSLVEIAVVVAIALILLSLGLTAINAQLSSASYSLTKKRQEAIKDALIAYLGSRKNFPCPYVPVAGTPATGVAPAQAGVPPACPAAFGTVPFADLGLAREVAEDGWGNLFSYQVYSVPSVCPGTGTDWANPLCFGTGKTGALTVRDGTIAVNTNLTTIAIVTLISHGPNGLGAWVASQGTRNAFPLTCEEAHNAQYGALAGCALVANTYYKGESQAIDDTVTYLTTNEVLPYLTKQGSVMSATAQVNADLQKLYDETIANNTSTADCSNPPSSVLYDPWGSQYVVNGSTGGTQARCLYTLASTGAAPTGSCVCVSPTTCRVVDKTTINNYRNRAGASPLTCP